MKNRIIPTYSAPKDLIDRLTAEKLQPGDMVIFNPNNGPTMPWESERTLIKTAVKFARNKGAFCFGYVHLEYGSRDIGNVVADVLAYNSLYGIKNIFFDESPSRWGSGEIGRLNALVSVVSGEGPVKQMYNMGAASKGTFKSPPKATIIVVYEGNGLPVHDPQPWEAAIVYSSLTCAVDTQAVYQILSDEGWNYAYATEDVYDSNQDNPFDGASTRR